ncbi:hypothetical protein BGX27_010692 [Mortierella sp. AM989]|nr:hypothetical protein BGX27_010692 [Mortierella sp. AM989]
MSPTRVFDSFLKSVPLSTFRGRPNENVRDWLSEIEEYFDIGNVSPEHRYKSARLVLRDNARRWAKQYVQHQSVNNSWESFKVVLLQRFESPNVKYFARSKLYKLKQRSSVTKYKLARKPVATMGQKRPDMANRTCFHCHQPNHQARQCPRKPEDQSAYALFKVGPKSSVS